MTDSLTVLSLNLHKGFSHFNRRLVLHELRDAIRGVGADLVFLQEVIGEHSGHAKRHVRWPTVPQYEFLADSIWSSHAYGRNAVYQEGHHGNALLSRYPIEAYDNLDVSTESGEPRGLLHCRILVPWLDQPLHAYCVHLGLREAHRQHQLRALADAVNLRANAAEPVIAAGDFNDWRQCGHAVLATSAGLREAFVESRGRAARSFPALLPMLRLDRIYLRGLCAASSRVLTQRPWSRLSDHAGLLCEVRPC
jgi:endonuclease/exonuclease/phosphatase family metal-dependent hydrolase